MTEDNNYREHNNRATENENGDQTITDLLSGVRWYWRYFSPKAPLDEKESLLERLLAYNWSLAENPPEKDAPLSDFPELRKYWHKDSISNIELVLITDELYRELKEDG